MINLRLLHFQKKFLMLWFSLLVFYPLFIYIIFKLNLSGAYQEALAYRYFYSLRWLWETNQHIWNPQGQLIGVLHHIINLMLDGLGFSAFDQNILLIRMNLFIITNAFMVAVATILSFHLIIKATSDWCLRVLAFLIFLTPIYCGDRFIHVLIWLRPDYISFCLPIYILSTYLVIKTLEAPYASNKIVIVNAIVAGLAVSLKITMMTLSLILFLLTILQGSNIVSLKKIIFKSFLFALISICTVLLVFILQYLRSVLLIPDIFRELLIFNAVSSHEGGLKHWIQDYTLSGGNAILFLTILFFALTMISIFVKFKKSIYFIIVCIPSLILTIPYVSSRWQSTTIFEFYCQMAMIIFVLFNLFLKDSKYFKNLISKPNTLLLIISWLGLILSTTAVFLQVKKLVEYSKPKTVLVENAFEIYKKLTTPNLFLSDWVGYEVLDDAIRRGGEDRFGKMQGKLNSNVMRAIFPNRLVIYMHDPNIEDINLNEYSTIALYQSDSWKPENESLAVRLKSGNVLNQTYKNRLKGINSWKINNIIQVCPKNNCLENGAYIIMTKSKHTD